MRYKSDWSSLEDGFLKEHYYLNNNELSDILGRPSEDIKSRRRTLGIKFEYVYALYNGDELLYVGSLEEISSESGLKISTLTGYNNKNRAGRRLVRLNI